MIRLAGRTDLWRNEFSDWGKSASATFQVLYRNPSIECIKPKYIETAESHRTYRHTLNSSSLHIKTKHIAWEVMHASSNRYKDED